MSLSETFEWRGRSIRWSCEGSGPPVVFCHGTPWSSFLWHKYAEILSDDFTVYLWDMAGYGESSKLPAHDVSLDVQGELFAALLEHWDLRSPHVVTHDYGGAVALRAHLLHKRGFDSLALIDVVALAPWGSAFFRLIKDNPAVFGSLPAAVHEGALRAYIAGASFHDLSGADMDALVGPWLGEVGQAAFYRQIAQADERYTDQVEPLYRDLRLPVLIGWGKEDTWIPVDRAETLASLIRGSQLKVLENAGHLIQLDQPVALAMLLQKWLLSQPSTQLNGGEGGLL